jgi:hypothetical protein
MRAILEVRPYNSTVLGRRPNPDHDAREWFDGWKNLGVHDKRSYVDGKARRRPGVNVFGYGKHRLSCGQYLHCPVLGEGADDRWYRVRCRFGPGGRYKGRTVIAVRLQRLDDKWHWILELK